jgi:hypothetical protein
MKRYELLKFNWEYDFSRVVSERKQRSVEHELNSRRSSHVGLTGRELKGVIQDINSKADDWQ